MQFYPTATLSNPFPNGLLEPVGNQLGALTGVGGEIRFIDQTKRAPHVHMYSADFNREIGGGFAVGFEYSGATGRDLGLGGANEGLDQHQPGANAVLVARRHRAERERSQPVLRIARGAGLQRDELNHPAPAVAPPVWKYEEIPGADGLEYTTIEVGDTGGYGSGGGMLRQRMPGAPSAWMPYVLVDDIEAATKKARELGAKVLKDVTEVPGMGALSILTDPTGAIIGLWQTRM